MSDEKNDDAPIGPTAPTPPDGTPIPSGTQEGPTGPAPSSSTQEGPTGPAPSSSTQGAWPRAEGPTGPARPARPDMDALRKLYQGSGRVEATSPAERGPNFSRQPPPTVAAAAPQRRAAPVTDAQRQASRRHLQKALRLQRELEPRPSLAVALWLAAGRRPEDMPRGGGLRKK